MTERLLARGRTAVRFALQIVFAAVGLSVLPAGVLLGPLAVCAVLAPVFLFPETEDPGLRDDFRARALGSSGTVVPLFPAICYPLRVFKVPALSGHRGGKR